MRVPVEIWTDGSSTGKVGPGGWAYVLTLHGAPVHCDLGGDTATTNNRMELTAAIRGLEAFLKAYGWGGAFEPVVVSDSKYVLGLIEGNCNPSKNIDLVNQLRRLCGTLRPGFRWVRGHSGEPFNERADRLAKRARAKIMGRPSGKL